MSLLVRLIAPPVFFLPRLAPDGLKLGVLTDVVGRIVLKDMNGIPSPYKVCNH